MKSYLLCSAIPEHCFSSAAFLDGFLYVLVTECRAISMGQGQEVHARRLVAQFMQGVSSPFY